jgi:glutathione S-transferase
MQLVGRSSSHFTRMPRIVAHELGVALPLVVIHDIAAVDATAYGENPALKLPSLRRADGSLLFGAVNICRAVAESAGAADRIVWPEDLRDDLSRNAHELVWHAAAAQVQLVMGTVVGKLPADNIFFAKLRTGYAGALAWLDAHLAAVPAPGPLRLLDVALFCLLDHLTIRPTLDLSPYPALTRFAATFAQRASALATPYRFDAPP